MEAHILNGDALAEKFPTTLSGKKIICRECLIDGDVSGNNLEEFYRNRALFIEKEYGIEREEYPRITISQLEKILNLPSNCVINLWFEDDLFCQCNLWFCIYILNKKQYHNRVFLVRPHSSLQYGFGALRTEELSKTFEKRQALSKEGIEVMVQLWNAYRLKDHSRMLKLAKDHRDEFPFLLEAVKAELERYPKDNSMGRPQRKLLEITAKHGKSDLWKIITEFQKTESIYGFGDLQFRSIINKLA